MTGSSLEAIATATGLKAEQADVTCLTSFGWRCWKSRVVGNALLLAANKLSAYWRNNRCVCSET
jgi:hypothetical protein